MTRPAAEKADARAGRASRLTRVADSGVIAGFSGGGRPMGITAADWARAGSVPASPGRTDRRGPAGLGPHRRPRDPKADP